MATPQPTKPNRLSTMKKWIIGIVVTAIGGFLTAQLTGQLHKLWDNTFPTEPITVNVSHGPQCPWVFTSSPVDVQRALDGVTGDWIANASRLGAVDGRESTVQITVQGDTDKAVELTGMRAVVTERAEPTGFKSGQCGGVLPVRPFAADLDQPVSTAVPLPGVDPATGKPIPPQSFPLRVTTSEIEVLSLLASTHGCDCTWKIEIDWKVGDRSGTSTATVDDRGRPFRTIAADALPFCFIDDKNRLRDC